MDYRKFFHFQCILEDSCLQLNLYNKNATDRVACKRHTLVSRTCGGRQCKARGPAPWGADGVFALRPHALRGLGSGQDVREGPAACPSTIRRGAARSRGWGAAREGKRRAVRLGQRSHSTPRSCSGGRCRSLSLVPAQRGSAASSHARARQPTPPRPANVTLTIY